MKYAKEFGHMLPILINYMVIHHTLTYCGIILSMINPTHITYSPTYPSVWRLVICIAIDNGSKNTVGGTVLHCGTHQAEGKHHIGLYLHSTQTTYDFK